MKWPFVRAGLRETCSLVCALYKVSMLRGTITFARYPGVHPKSQGIAAERSPLTDWRGARIHIRDERIASKRF